MDVDAVGYRALNETDAAGYLAGLPVIAARLGSEPWSVREVGDGNLNLVFIVTGAAGGAAVKQALPYVRLVGESWPLSMARAHYEHMALVEQGRLAPGLTPQVLHYDPDLALIVMELLEPHVIVRRGMIAGRIFPRFAADVATFMARTLFFTSDLALSAEEKKTRIAAFAGNTAMCKITEDLIFDEPYRIAERNRWTQPWLDAHAAALREDLDLHVAASRLKLKFLSSAEAMIHGDLHTGSIMATEEDTRIIDPEFAFYGPMGFDVGAVIANLFMHYFASEGHERAPGERAAYEDWTLETVEATWTGFRRNFLDLWRSEARGDAYSVGLFEGSLGAMRLETERQAYMDRLFADSLGFAGAKTIRRIVGLAHNIDFEWIEDARRRAVCEARALKFGRELIVNAESFRSIDAVIEAARLARRWRPYE